MASGQDLIDSNHYATDAIEERCVELSGSWDLLIGASAERKQKLDDALELQKVSWLKHDKIVKTFIVAETLKFLHDSDLTQRSRPIEPVK